MTLDEAAGRRVLDRVHAAVELLAHNRHASRESRQDARDVCPNMKYIYFVPCVLWPLEASVLLRGHARTCDRVREDESTYWWVVWVGCFCGWLNKRLLSPDGDEGHRSRGGHGS